MRSQGALKKLVLSFKLHELRPVLIDRFIGSPLSRVVVVVVVVVVDIDAQAACDAATPGERQCGIHMLII